MSDPLSLATGDELVDDALGGVGKVTKLTLPENQGIWVGHGIAELKAKDAILRERAVADGVGRLVGIQVGQRVVGRPEQHESLVICLPGRAENFHPQKKCQIE